jgi:ribosomal protein L2
MPIKELKKTTPAQVIKSTENTIEKFISQGGSLAQDTTAQIQVSNEEHRLTLRIPKELLERIDTKRKERVGKISRNLWILEQIEKASKK